MSRDEDHDWAKDCEMCSVCQKTRPNAHSWNGCKCKKCGKDRDEQHDWFSSCECSVCGRKQPLEEQVNTAFHLLKNGDAVSALRVADSLQKLPEWKTRMMAPLRLAIAHYYGWETKEYAKAVVATRRLLHDRPELERDERVLTFFGKYLAEAGQYDYAVAVFENLTRMTGGNFTSSAQIKRCKDKLAELDAALQNEWHRKYRIVVEAGGGDDHQDKTSEIRGLLAKNGYRTHYEQAYGSISNDGPPRYLLTYHPMASAAADTIEAILRTTEFGGQRPQRVVDYALVFSGVFGIKIIIKGCVSQNGGSCL
jgi:hypothetical protein